MSHIVLLSLLQVDLHKEMVVSGILTQGHPLNSSWVTEFGVWWSIDCERFRPVFDAQREPAVSRYSFNCTIIPINVFFLFLQLSKQLSLIKRKVMIKEANQNDQLFGGWGGGSLGLGAFVKTPFKIWPSAYIHSREAPSVFFQT